MAQIHYIDNEVPDYAEWDAVVEIGSSAIIQTDEPGEASFPERGSWGLRCTVSGGNRAYAKKALASALSSMALGFWFKFPSEPTWEDGQYFAIAQAANATRTGFRLLFRSDNGQAYLTLAVYAAGNGAGYSDTYYLQSGRWYYIAIIATWDGSAATGNLYIDGVHRGQAQKAGDATSNYVDDIRMGNAVNATGLAATLDLDEIKIRDDTTYPEPYVPTPANEYPSAHRTVVLWRGASADSRDFADYCQATLLDPDDPDRRIPRANLIRLDNASADEALADYATFQTQVEDDIATYLGLHPTVAANCSCFLIGYGVPGYFTDGGLGHSAASRLMNYGTAFSSGTANALYNPSTVARLTKTALGGKYLCTRIDADTLRHAKDVIDRAAVVSALSELVDADKLYSDDATYKAALNCQQLRILTATLGTYSNDAFVWGDTGAPSFNGAGSRACFADDSDDSADLLRSGSAACQVGLFTGEYAAALGSADTADTFDAESFFEMLRIGGTLAEAFAVAISKLDYTAVPVGDPLMTVAFQNDGYNLYRGLGDVTSVDWDTVLAYLRSDASAATLASLGHVASTRYTYGLRPVRNGLETPDYSCTVEFETDGDTEWLGSRPGAVDFLEAEILSGGQIRLRWGYTTPYGSSAPADFGIYHSGSPDITPGSPDATESYGADGIYTKTLTLSDATTYWFGITARTSGGVESHLSEIIGPYVADSTAPAAPTLYASNTF